MKEALLKTLPPRIYLALRRWDYRRTCKEKFGQLQDMRRLVTTDGYSYKPFDDNRSIFVHIPKCVGVSVSRALFGNLAGGHTTLEEYLDIFEPRCIIDYFKFTVVRNPWDRVVSAYFFLKHGGLGESDRSLFEKELGGFRDFGDFVKNWINRSNIWKWYHFRPQHHYMLDKRQKVHLDFVAFTENIDSDFATIAHRMGLGRALPKSNRSDHSRYQDYYSDETADIVARTYAEDIEMLGYTFDNSSLARQLIDRDAGKVYHLRPHARGERAY